MNITRRSFLHGAAGTACGPILRAGRGNVRIGVTDWQLQKPGQVEAVALAKQLGFDGIELSLGRKPDGDHLPLADKEAQARYLAAAKQQGIALAGTCVDILHINYLKNDKLGRKWFLEGIGITRSLSAKVMLVPFFGKGALATREDMNYVGDVLRELAPEAVKAGVLLGIEDTISAEDNVRIMEQSRSSAVKVYYDVGNSANKGFDVLKEIRWLGKDRIAQIHLKDKGYLGEGKIDFRAVMKAIFDIGFQGFANLETSSPSNSVERDMAKNLAYIRGLMTQ